ncbi:MAG: threonine/serine exporter [Hungatella sp.]|nr:threonine/serine exporter [Hungatella sp.]
MDNRNFVVAMIPLIPGSTLYYAVDQVVHGNLAPCRHIRHPHHGMRSGHCRRHERGLDPV